MPNSILIFTARDVCLVKSDSNSWKKYGISIYKTAYFEEAVKELNTGHYLLLVISLNKDNKQTSLISHDNLIGNGKWQTRTVAKILADEVYTFLHTPIVPIDEHLTTNDSNRIFLSVYYLKESRKMCYS